MKHCFVENIPEKSKLENDTLYISLKYNVAIHKCACGCGNEVVTPFDEINGWVLSYNGKSISLSPSIGNWNLPCKSHYWISNGEVYFISESKKKKKKKRKRFRFFQFKTEIKKLF